MTTRYLRGLGLKRNEAGRVLATDAVRWRCEIHQRINHPNYPGCGCPNPLRQVRETLEEECRHFRDQRADLDPSVGRRTSLDHEAIRSDPRVARLVAADLGCSISSVHQIRAAGRRRA